LHCTPQHGELPAASANDQPGSNRRTVMVRTASTETDKAVDVARDAADKSMPTKQAIAAAPDMKKVTMNVPNIAGDFLAIFQQNMEAFTKAQQIIINGNKIVLDKKVDVFKSTFEHTMKSAQDIVMERDLKIKTQKIFDVVRSGMRDSTGNNNIIAETNARFIADAAQIVQSRTFEMLDEVQALCEKMLDAIPATSRR
jgi:azurin